MSDGQQIIHKWQEFKIEEVQSETAPEATEVEPVRSETLQVTMGTLYSTVIIVSLVMSVLSVFAYDRYFALRLGTYDLPGHVLALRNDLVAKMQSGAITEPQAQELMVKDLEGVNNMINALPKNIVVISGDTILGTPKRLINIPDTTQWKTNAPGAANGQNFQK